MKKLFFLLVIGFAVLLFTGFVFWFWANQPVNRQDAQKQIFTVPQGQPTSTISRRLKQNGFIKSDIVFQLLVGRKNLSQQLQAGDFYLSPSMNLESIIEALAHGSQDFWITLPEGLRVEQIAEKLSQESAIEPQEFILAAKPYEGQLFPDTYLIPHSASVQDIVNLLVDTFSQKSPTQDKSTIIIASLIEREARHQVDRPLISSVIYNRLDISMALQIDATVQYVLGESGNWWPQNLTSTDLAVNSPYNTYQHPGLPPAPICNPGLESLKAAVNPAETGYLYYVSDSQGYSHYAADLEGHQQNISQYLNH